MKKTVFAISVLSLAIAGVNQTYAETPSAPQECVVEGGQGNSLQEWGIWCGVGTFLAALAELDPTAAGPGDGPELDLNVNPPGRGDADDFDPEADPEETPEEPVIPPAPEPEPEPQVTPPHIVLPGSGDFVGYFASQDRSYSYDYESEEEGYGDVTNHQTGGFNLSLTDGDEFDEIDEGYGDPTPDIVEYGRFDHDGNPIDSNSFSSENDHYDHEDNEGEGWRSEQHTEVYLTDDDEDYGDFNAYRYDESYSYEYEDESEFESESGEGISGMEVLVFQGAEDEGGQLQIVDENFEILKNYWAGHFVEGSYTEEDGFEMGNLMMGAFVAGQLTPLEDIQSLISGDVDAVYTGNSHQWRQSVRLEVDFGEQRFSGEFGDMDMYRKYEAGISEETDMSFTAEGVIEGVELISETVSADEGFVQGSFFGEGGDIVGGAYDVTKGEDRVVDVFTAVEGEGNIVDGGYGFRPGPGPL